MKLERDLLDDFQAAQTNTNKTPGAVPLLVTEFEPRSFEGHLAGADGEGDEACHLLQLLLGDVLGRLPLLHLSREAARVLVADLELGDGGDPASPSDERLPGFFGPDAVGRDQTDSGDDDAFHGAFRTRERSSALPGGSVTRTRGQSLLCSLM